MGYHDQISLSQETEALSERRAYPRFRVALHGICSIGGAGDKPCTVLDLSLGGAKVICTGKVALNDKISFLLPHLGLLSARIVHMTEEGFGIAFEGGVPQRRRVQDYLVFVLQMQDDRLDEARAFDRIVPLRKTVEVRRFDGRTHMARIRDVSRSGIALTTTVAMAVGEDIVVGGTTATIVRTFDGGAAASFTKLLPPTFDATIAL